MTYDWKAEMPDEDEDWVAEARAAARRAHRALRRHMAALRLKRYFERERGYLIFSTVVAAVASVLGDRPFWAFVGWVLVVAQTLIWDIYEEHIMHLQRDLAAKDETIAWWGQRYRNLEGGMNVLLNDEWKREQGLERTPLYWQDGQAYYADDDGE